MIGHLTGKLLEKQPPQLVIDVGGVGYEIDAPMSTIYVLPHVGEAVSLFTHMVVREDAQLLYGFATRAERDLVPGADQDYRHWRQNRAGHFVWHGYG